VSYQFIHFEDYSITKAKKKTNREEQRIKEQKEEKYKGDYNEETKGRSLREVIAEAKREVGNCPHVENPSDPILLYGVDLDTVENMALNYHAKTKTKDKNGKEKKLRSDANVILSGVVSLNRDNENIWEDYKNDSIKYLKEKYGDKLKSVIEHTDESHPHFHFYCIQDPGDVFDLIHDGKKASLEARSKNKLKGEQNTAYINAMRKYQEDFFLNVSSKYGLTKDGPKRKRLSRDDYLNQKREIELLNQLKQKAETELFLLKEKTDLEIQSLRKEAEKDIKTIKENASALSRRVGKSEGIKSAILDFEKRNYFNKVIFSRTFNNDMIRQLKNENELLKDKNKKLFKRKEHYKKDSIYKSKYSEEEKKNDYLKSINNIFKLEEEIIENKKEIENDIRANIIREINKVEAQQQQINSGHAEIKQRDTGNRDTVKSFKERLGRSFRLLFNNIKATLGDFLSNKLFEKRSQRSEEIKTTIESLEKEYEVKIKEDPGINRNRKIKKV